MLHLVAKEEESLPEMKGNTYIQYLGNPLGQYGANATAEPDNMPFDNTAEEKIKNIMCDESAEVYFIK